MFDELSIRLSGQAFCASDLSSVASRPDWERGLVVEEGGCATSHVAAKLNCLIGYKVELSKLNSSRRAVGMWKSLFFSDFQGLWEARETALCFPRFPSGQHFHRPSFSCENLIVNHQIRANSS
jgi:hypothetical protein